jgi:GNAT superfamily N-acetyltransferase
MFVVPESRGSGIARRLLEAMETWARGWGYRMLRLETGARQPEAIVLYESSGYVPTAPFGEYADSPLANFYEKRLMP